MKLSDTQPIRLPGSSVSGYHPTTTDTGAIRRFSDKRIEDSISKALSGLGKGKRGAVVMYADKKGVHGAVYGRKKGSLWFLPPGEWSYVGTLGTTYQGQLEAEAALAYSCA